MPATIGPPMKNDETPPLDPRITRALQEMHSLQVKHLNRVMACEALLHSMLQLVPTNALGPLEDEYDQAIDRLASGLPPRQQRKELWAEFSKAIAELRRAKRPPEYPPPPSSS